SSPHLGPPPRRGGGKTEVGASVAAFHLNRRFLTVLTLELLERLERAAQRAALVSRPLLTCLRDVRPSFPSSPFPPARPARNRCPDNLVQASACALLPEHPRSQSPASD